MSLAADMKTVQDRIDEYGAMVRARLEPQFREAGVEYPPKALTLIGLKQEKLLRVFASGKTGKFRYVCEYAMQAASGTTGPKLRQGDRQVPEGIYRIESLNPNSRFHLALRINYPNEFDRARAAEDGRTHLGGDIMIHGHAVSRGCLAMGDPAAEELFVLAALNGIENIKVILAPCDLRLQPAPTPPHGAPHWIATLYREIEAEMQSYPKSGSPAKAD